MRFSREEHATFRLTRRIKSIVTAAPSPSLSYGRDTMKQTTNHRWFLLSVSALALSTLFVTNSYGQFGACAPSCDLPTPSCGVPTATCAPTCEPTCAPSCDYGVGCNTCCGLGCYGGCTILDGALAVVTSPFRWIACAMTDGIYPDCGCAPPVPKTKCDPCTICGDYVGGCNDQCRNGRGNCYGAINYQAQYANSEPYSVDAYDAESYDSSPTRINRPNSFQDNGAIETLPPEAIRNNYSMKRSVFAPNVRSVSYEQQTQQRVAQTMNATRIEKISAASVNVRPDTQPVNTQLSASQKTFGTTRPIK